jgi:iron(III) transport system substrate-binding protein
MAGSHLSIATCSAALLSIALTLAGPGSHGTAAALSLEDAARQEGKVVVYGSLESETRDAIQIAFRLKDGVSIDDWRGAGNKVIDRALTEFRAGKPSFDVVLTNRGPMRLLKNEGMFIKYRSPRNANFPASTRDPDNVLFPIYRIALIGILYNTKLVKPEDAPKALEDFLSPKWRGKWVIADPTQHPTTEQWLCNLQKLHGADWLALVRKLAETRPIVVESFIPAVQKIISGEALAGITYVKYVRLYGKDGAPLDYVRLPKMLSEGHTAAISARAPHSNAAKLFENFLISREGMQIEADQGEFVTAKGIYPPIKDADKIHAIVFDELTSEEFKKWAAEFRPLFVAK